MSSHIWSVKKFGPRAVADAKCVIKFCLEKGNSVADALTFTGYYLERTRQNGGGGVSAVAYPWATEAGFKLLTKTYAGAAKRGNKYAAGKNAANYRLAGERLVAAMAAEVDLSPAAPPYMTLDKLAEEGKL